MRETSARVTQLEPGTSYNIKVTVADAAGNETTAPSLNVRTLQDPDRRQPAVERPAVEAIGDRWVRVRWSTDEPTDGFVDFNPIFPAGAQADQLVPVRRIVDRSVGTDHQVTLTQLDQGQEYILQVGVTDLAGNGPVRSAIVSFQTLAEPDAAAPAPPADLTAVATGTAVLVQWAANVEEDVEGYNIYRQAGNVYDPVATQVQDAAYLDSGLEPGQTYRYRVTAVDRQQPYNESEASAEASAATATLEEQQAPVVVGLERSADPSTPFVVVDNVSGASAEATYTIQVASSAEFADVVARSSRIGAGAIGRTRWRVDEPLEVDTAYWWRARAVDGLFIGPWSDGVELTPNAAGDRPARALVGDFNEDGVVDFLDFFAFVDGFNSVDPLFDLDDDGSVGFLDLFVFVDHFGDVAAGKELRSSPQSLPTLAGSQLFPTATATAAGDLVTLDLQISGVSGLRGFGVVIGFDANLDYVGVVDSVGWRAPEAVELSVPEMGRLYLGRHLIAPEASRSGQASTVRVQFRLRGIPRNLEFPVEEVVVSLGSGRIARLEQVGTASVLPQAYGLWPNFPNPFNPSTTITFAIPAAPNKIDGSLLRIYNVQGQVVREWPLSGFGAGFHALVWDGLDADGREVASGVYLSHLQAGRFRRSHKLLLLK